MRFTVLATTLLCLGFLFFAEKPWITAIEAEQIAASGKKPLLAHYIARGLWFGFAGSSIAGILLIFTWKRWCGALRPYDRKSNPPVEHMAMPLFLLLLAGITILGGCVRWNLAKRGLWWDEIWSVKFASLGYLKEKDDTPDEFRFIKRGWNHAFWNYRKPTNHPPVSVLSKISQSIWRKLTGAPDHKFNALAVRIPTFAAGLASILAIGLLVRRWGFSSGAIAAALFLALHPWHIRYGIEARSYSLAVLWVILGCLWLTCAMADERCRWRYWLLFGLNQMMITWSLPNGFWYAAAFAIAGSIVIFRQWNNRDGRKTAIARLLAVNLMAAMVFLPLFMPNLLQALDWGPINDHAMLTWTSLKNAICQMAFGMNIASGPGIESEGIHSLTRELASAPWVTWPTISLLVSASLFGASRLGLNRPGATTMLVALALATIASLLLTKITGQHFYHRYIIYCLVPLAIWFGIGLSGITRVITPRPAVATLIAITIMGLYLYTTRKPRQLLNSRPYAPFENIANHLDSLEKKSGAPIHVVGYGLGGRMMQVYYHKTRFAKNLTDLKEEIAAAHQHGRPLFVVLGYRELNRKDPEYSDGFSILDEPGAFHESRSFQGIDPLFYFRILELIPPIHDKSPSSTRAGSR
ncbi:MAG: glycosyltransferase family 39 protein [Verrucomicrobiales bacterium]